MPRLAFFAPFSFFAAVLSLAAQDPAPAKAAPVFVDGQAPLRYVIKSDQGFNKEVEFLLLGPYGPAGGTK